MVKLIKVIILLGVIYILEKKAINKLTAYAGIILLTAMLLMYDVRITEIGGEYISYILVLVQLSALTILFGFIIMLFPPIYNIRLITDIDNKKYRVMNYVKTMVLLLILIFFIQLFFEFSFTSFIHSPEPLLPSLTTSKSMWLVEGERWAGLVKGVEEEWKERPFFISKFDDSLFIRKLGYYLYNYPLKILILTLLLFLAIVNIFFLF